MVPGDLINAGEWDKIEQLTREAVQTMLGFELAHVGVKMPSLSPHFAICFVPTLYLRSAATAHSPISLSGITPAVSDAAAELTEKALIAAKKHGVKVSVDLNFRKKLWSGCCIPWNDKILLFPWNRCMRTSRCRKPSGLPAERIRWMSALAMRRMQSWCWALSPERRM